MKKLLLLVVLMCLFTWTAFALSMTLSNSGTGSDSAPVIVSVTGSGAPAGSTITSTSVTCYIGSYIANWYDINLTIGGTTYTNVGNLTDAVYANLNGLNPNGQVITVTSVDLDDYSDGVTLTLSVTINYDPPAGAPGVVTVPSPTDGALNVALASGNLTWTWGADTATYDLWFGPTGSMVKVVDNQAVGTASYTYPALPNYTAYTWQVISKNATARQTTNGPVWSFTTTPPIISFPYSASFDGTTFVPANWANTPVVGTYLWNRSTTGTSPTCTTHSGAGMARFNCYNISAGNKADLVTPAIAIPVGEAYQLKFWMFRDSGYLTYADLINVYENSTPTSVGGTLKGTINRSYSLAPVVAVANQWYEYTFNLTIESARTERYIIFQAVSQYGNNIFIDDISVAVAPAVPIFSISPVNKNFGYQLKDTSAFQEFVITNTGGAPLVINAADITFAGGSSGYYTFDPLPTNMNIGGGLTDTLRVEYRPDTAGGPYTAIINIIHNAAGSPQVDSLTGMCNDPTIVAPIAQAFPDGTIPTDWTLSGPQSWLFAGSGGYGAATNGGKDPSTFAWVDGSGSAALTGITLTTPPIDVTALSTPQLKFGYFTNNITTPLVPADQNTLKCDVWSADVWTNIFTDNSNDPAWRTATISLAGYTSPIMLRFVVDKGTGNVFYDDILIDDVKVQDPPTGPPNPVALGLPVDDTINSTNQPTFTFTPSELGNPAERFLVYCDANADPTTLVGTVTAAPYQYTCTVPLTYGGVYNWKVVANRTVEGNSVGNEIRTLTVMADPTISVTDTPFNYGFEEAVYPPLGWTSHISTGTYSIVRADSSNNTDAVYPRTGGWMGVYDSWNAPNGDSAWLSTPPISMTGLYNYSVSFWVWRDSTNTSYTDKFVVYSSSSGSIVADSTYLGTIHQSLTAEPVSAGPPGWQQFTYEIGSGSRTVKHVFFQAVSNYGNTMNLDDIQIFRVAGGTPPNAVNMVSPVDAAVGIAVGTSPLLSWLSGGGAPTGYRLNFGTDGGGLTPPTSIANNLEMAMATTYTPASPLDFGTTYYWQVMAYNGTPPATASAIHSFTTVQAQTMPFVENFAGATIPTGWSQSYSGAVVSNRWAVSVSANAGGEANEMMATYTNGTGVTRLMTPPINVAGVTDLNLSFRHFYNSYGAGISYKVQTSPDGVNWTDTSWSYAGGTVDATGIVSIRIANTVNTKYFAWVLDGDHYQFDYWYIDNVSVKQQLPYDVGTASIGLNEALHPTVVTPQATVINYGLNITSFDVSMTITGGYLSTKTVTLLAPDSTFVVIFDPFTPTLGSSYTVDVATSLRDDGDATNNALSNELVCVNLNVTAYAFAASPSTMAGPSTFNLRRPYEITRLAISPLPLSTDFLSGGSWINGIWYGVQYSTTSSTLWTINNVSGAMVSLGTVGVGLSAITYDKPNNVLYASTATALYTLDRVTRVCTLIGTFGTGIIGVLELAVDFSSGTLYAIDNATDALYTVNKTTGAATLVGALGVNLNYAQDMCFDQVNGNLYLAGYASTGALYWIDTVTGGAYNAGRFQNGAEMDCFVIPYAPDSPVVTVSLDPVALAPMLSWQTIPGAASYQVNSDLDATGTFGTLEYSTTGLSWTDENTAGVDNKFYKVKAIGNSPAARSARPVLTAKTNHFRDLTPPSANVAGTRVSK